MNPNNEALTPLLNEATELLKALSHPARLMICCELKNRELSVGEIEDRLNIRQPRLSSELAKLRTLDLVTTRRESKLIYYTMNKETRAIAMVDAICAVMIKDVQSLELSDVMQNVDIIDHRANSVEREKPEQECGVFARVNIPEHRT